VNQVANTKEWTGDDSIAGKILQDGGERPTNNAFVHHGK
jgi:hypothetical protein